MSIIDCALVDLHQIKDSRGNLTVVEGRQQIPFDIKRVYYLHGVTKGSERGGHAHKDLSQLIIAVSGSFDIHINDGRNSKTIHLNTPNLGLYLCPMIWRTIDNFSNDAVCLVLASHFYDENDYYRDYSEFLSNVN